MSCLRPSTQIYNVTGMKKRLTFLFLIAALTAGGIILFQCYWVYSTYKAGQRNFNQRLSDALQKSVENYQVQQSQLPSTLKSLSPYLSILETIPVDTGKHEKIRYGAVKNQPYPAKIEDVQVNPANLQRVKVMLAETQFMSSILMDSVRLDELKDIFTTELKSNNIELPFNLVLLKNQQTLPPGKIAAYINYSKNSPIVEAFFSNTKRILILQNIVPALVSIVLVLLSAGSLYYIGIIVRRQMKLDRMKNDFFNNITHELRTPISILKTANDALYRYGQAADPEKNQRYLKINAEILDKLDHNVDRILEITQYEQGTRLAKVEPVNLNELIGEIIARFSLNEAVTLQYTYGLETETVAADKYVVDTVLSNLVDNSIKYANKAVIIAITVTPFRKGWQLEVKDNGKGIPDIHLPYIFDKFYRVQDGDLHTIKGYGLGLSYVKQLLTAVKGDISVKSKEGAGAIFTVKFFQYG
jgi:two-component system phosphate regulon sensor histidine kinase PhoR